MLSISDLYIYLGSPHKFEWLIDCVCDFGENLQKSSVIEIITTPKWKENFVFFPK
jgi:hypothetical protein